MTEMEMALAADGEKLSALTGEDHGPFCPECFGSGVCIGFHPICCGNLTKSGECRADCAIPEEHEEQCPTCGGTGKLPDIRALAASKGSGA